MKKITLATLKSFIRKNESSMMIKVCSSFDGMTDCVQPTYSAGFSPIQKADFYHEGNLGFEGVWIVRGSRDYITAYETAEFSGYEVSNCCGTFVLATKKG